MDNDLDRIRNLGANTVRIFVHPWSVGYPQPSDQFTASFEEALALIAAHGLKAHVTLFDCWWSWPEIADSRTWLAALSSRIETTRELPSGNFKTRSSWTIQPSERGFKSLLPYLKQQAGTTPITVSVGNVEWLDDVRDLSGATPPDIYSLHWYPSEFWWTPPFPSVLYLARQLLGSADLLVGEFGYNTYTLSETSQANLYHDVLYYTAQKGIHDLSAWTLNDFPTGTAQCAGNVPSAAEWHFGLYRLDGSPKPATVVLKASFQGHDPIDPAATYVINEFFETANLYLEKVENWRSWDQNWSGNQTFVQDCTLAHTGRCSAKVHGFPNLVNGLYSLPILTVELGQSWTLQGYLRTQNLQGWAKIVLSWFDSNQRWLDQDTSSQLITTIDLEEWTKVAMGPTAPPPEAAFVQVFAQVYTTDPATYVWFDDITTQPNKLYMPTLWRRS